MSVVCKCSGNRDEWFILAGTWQTQGRLTIVLKDKDRNTGNWISRDSVSSHKDYLRKRTMQTESMPTQVSSLPSPCWAGGTGANWADRVLLLEENYYPSSLGRSALSSHKIRAGVSSGEINLSRQGRRPSWCVKCHRKKARAPARKVPYEPRVDKWINLGSIHYDKSWDVHNSSVNSEIVLH